MVETLGMKVDMKARIIKALKGRVERPQAFLARMIQTSYPTTRQLAKLTGYYYQCHWIWDLSAA